MARLATIGFELNSITADTKGSGGTSGGGSVTISSTQAHSGTYSNACSVITTSGFANGNLVLSSNTDGVYFTRFYVYFTGYPSGTNTILSSTNAAGTNYYGGIFMNSSGQLGITYMSGAQVANYDTTLTSAISLNTWHYIELQVNSTTTNTQAIIFKLDGTQISTKTGTATQTASTLGGVAWGVSVVESGVTMAVSYWDDLAVNDNTGSFQNTFAGAGNVARFTPSGAGDSNTFGTQIGGTAGSANNYTRVDEVTPDTTTSYNGSASAATDFYTVSGVTIPTGATINVVQTGVSFRASVASNAASFQTQVKKTTGGTIASGTAITPSGTTFKTNNNNSNTSGGVWSVPQTLYQDPDSINWTPTTISTMQIGMTISTVNTNRADITTIWAYVDYTPATNTNTKGIIMGFL